MGFFGKIIKKLTAGYFYVVDIKTLNELLQKDLEFSLLNNLEVSTDLNIYYKEEKHHLQIWNHGASNFPEEKAKGLIIYYDDIEYKTIEECMNNATIANIKLKDIEGYFKIELTESDSEFLNEYQKNHPELNVEDY